MTTPSAPDPDLDRALVRLLANESLRPLLGGLAHHFNNLLSGILGWVSLAPTLPPDTLATLSGRVKEQVEQASRLTHLVLSITRRAAENATQMCELKHWAEGSVALVKTATPPHVQLLSQLPEDEVWAAVSPVAYCRLVLDLLLTAIHLSPPGKTTKVWLRIASDADRCLTVIECPGFELRRESMPPLTQLVCASDLPTAVLAWTTASAVVRDLGGELTVGRGEDGATAWTVRLPAAPRAR